MCRQLEAIGDGNSRATRAYIKKKLNSLVLTIALNKLIIISGIEANIFIQFLMRLGMNL